MVVQVYHPYRQPDYPNHCLPFNGHCSHFCLPAPHLLREERKTSCKCPEQLSMDEDGRTCREKGESRKYLFAQMNIFLQLGG